ncbi:Zn-dependent oxidoreductase [Halobaculum magnesiiphilum]|uniref:Zn-dependent oxidoreductase n=1 Tax=Halobaculum magnesiiphilum TaxID=1017351 RepID=UPI001CEC781C|nr:Zn-dependent oxidoreductase [Halobaculum magnesiiphilum]
MDDPDTHDEGEASDASETTAGGEEAAADLAVACTLTEDERRERAERARSTLADAYRGTRDAEDGIVLVFDGIDGTIADVAGFVSAERRCCSFAAYSIEISPPYEETWLRISGPDGTAELFEDGLVESFERTEG